ncbi:cell division protein FtsL [Phenylobacterium sp.]|uniref:cell division protein FtsL n=1 Tax=Phenylobacterium sp. TaxID=1871053 RepID=UPI002DEDA025|nr:cell division protein [Phenylobacterium sp.]
MSLLARRVRGFRLVDLVALSVLMLLILGVYLAKTVAGRERADIASAERQIEGEKARIRLLQAEVTHLERPARIEKLSETYLGMAPVSIKHEASPDVLGDIAIHPAAPSPTAELPGAPAAAPPLGAAR